MESRTGTKTGDWNSYIDYMNRPAHRIALPSMVEIGGIWFDGMWDKPDADWRLAETYSLIHQLQPGTLIGSNHHKMPYPGEDFMMFERDLPGENSMGFNNTGISNSVPLEMCETMNGSWGFNFIDKNYKSVKKLVQTMVRAAGYGANFLLNTGPMPNGLIQPENIDTLMAIGHWLELHGESVYGTRKGPVKPQDWGATTRKGNSVYVHVLDHKGGTLELAGYAPKITSARFLDDGDEVSVKRTGNGIILTIPKEKLRDIDTVIVLQLK